VRAAILQSGLIGSCLVEKDGTMNSFALPHVEGYATKCAALINSQALMTDDVWNISALYFGATGRLVLSGRELDLWASFALGEVPASHTWALDEIPALLLRLFLQKQYEVALDLMRAFALLTPASQSISVFTHRQRVWWLQTNFPTGPVHENHYTGLVKRFPEALEAWNLQIAQKK
jgi:hypothetical protein